LTAQQESRILEKINGLGGRQSPDEEHQAYSYKGRTMPQLEEDDEELAGNSRPHQSVAPPRHTHRKEGVGPKESGLLGQPEGSFLPPEAFYECPVRSRVALKQYPTRLPKESKSTIPLDVQEALVMQDLLHVMAGLSGQWFSVSEEDEAGKEQF